MTVSPARQRLIRDFAHDAVGPGLPVEAEILHRVWRRYGLVCIVRPQSVSCLDGLDVKGALVEGQYLFPFGNCFLQHRLAGRSLAGQVSIQESEEGTANFQAHLPLVSLGIHGGTRTVKAPNPEARAQEPKPKGEDTTNPRPRNTRTKEGRGPQTPKHTRPNKGGTLLLLRHTYILLHSCILYCHMLFCRSPACLGKS